MRKLILLTDYYPFSTGEPFLENEVPYLESNFELSIISSDVYSEKTRNTSAKVYRVMPKSGYSFIEKLRYAIEYFTCKDGRREIAEIIQNKKNIKRSLVSSLYFYVQSQDFYRQVREIIDLDTYKDAIIYSYWSNYKLLAFTHSREWNTVVTRMHGYDLFHERFDTGRQPFKNQMSCGISKAIFASEAGLNYYLKTYVVSNPDDVVLCRLGTNEPRNYPRKEESKKYLICSCSNVIPIKHVELIIEALSLIEDRDIKWIHFGDGINFEEIVRKAELLPDNIEYVLKGRVPNQGIVDFYSKNYIDCFITTSETEGGCPVSIMEALSFGIPIIATSVGGITEMIQETDNILLSERPDPKVVCDAIKEMMSRDEERISRLRERNIEHWKNNFDTKTNAALLVSLLRELQ